MDPYAGNEKELGFSDRLREAMKGKGIRELCKETGISYGTMQKYLSGAAMPKLDNLIAIADISWLATGKQGDSHAPSALKTDESMDFIVKAISMLEGEEHDLLAKLFARKGVDESVKISV